MFPDRGGNPGHDRVLVDELIGRARSTSGVYELRHVAEVFGDRNPVPTKPRTRRPHRCRRRGTWACHPGSRRRALTALQTFLRHVRCSRCNARCWLTRTAPLLLPTISATSATSRSPSTRSNTISAWSAGRQPTSASTALCAVSRSTACVSVSRGVDAVERVVERHGDRLASVVPVLIDGPASWRW